jgi:Fe2+ or Zn2+ uptake regulation protein
LIERLKAAGLRPTRQRLALARLLQDGGDRHLSAEQLHEEASKTTTTSISKTAAGSKTFPAIRSA